MVKQLAKWSGCTLPAADPLQISELNTKREEFLKSISNTTKEISNGTYSNVST